ncbi:phosphatase PAP2 family protein [Granulicoccus phenolivorans]|uniref:phosphatase PAP2 family protein n=1 Tax=Granulicoccus phenolivorans TaxID=266854 RepID=UPI000684C003|nr:phosphatase PAP2 family protein [Granulicoccus phenolivorans]
MTESIDRDEVSEGWLGGRVRAWRWVVLGVALFAVSIGLGLVARSWGVLTPEILPDEAMARHRDGVLDALAQAVNYGIGPVGAIVLLIVVCLWLFLRGRRLDAARFGSVTVVVWLGAAAAKIIVPRLRPPADAVHPLAVEALPDSFPSGHTAFALALGLAVFLVLTRTRAQRWAVAVIGLLFAVGVGLARLYLGVHYPSDVIAPFLISAAMVLIWLPIWNRTIEPRVRPLLESPRWSLSRRGVATGESGPGQSAGVPS